MSTLPPAQPTRKNGTDLAPAFPIWVRIPKHGTRCPYTGLSRSYIFGLVKQAKVRSKVILNDKTSVKGVRLISLQSLLDFIESVPDIDAGIDAAD